MHSFGRLALALGILTTACGTHVLVEGNPSGGDEGGGGTMGPASTTTTTTTVSVGGGPSSTSTTVGGSGGAPTGPGGSGGMMQPVDTFDPPAPTHNCFTAQFGSIKIVELESSTSQAFSAAPQGWWDPASGSNAVFEQDAIYDCNGGTITKHAYNGPSWDTSNAPCWMTARVLDAGFVAAPYNSGSSVTLYTSFAAAEGGNGTTKTLSYQNVTQMAVHDTVLYTAPYWGGPIGRHSLETGEEFPPLVLIGFNSSIDGFDVTDDGLLVVNNTWSSGKLGVYDATTGAWLYDVALSTSNGLNCWAVY
jgi:hypothetical protein